MHSNDNLEKILIESNYASTICLSCFSNFTQQSKKSGFVSFC